ncbi:MAG: peptidoglycan DD-metalloendopeptidase family protein [Spirosomataceae bacterium]
MKQLLSFLFLSTLLHAQKTVFFGQQQLTHPVANCIPPEVEKQVLKQVAINFANVRVEAASTETMLLDWPLRQRAPLDYTYYGLSFFVDHNLATGPVLDYNGGNRTYDGHTGTDISPQPYQWDMMDNSRVEVIAAAAGTIVLRQDGNYDRRCSSDPNFVGNAVILQHSDGSQTWYWHLKNGSVTNKTVGQTVQQGEYLGIIGSSGMSGGPHLHFEVRNASNQIVDPFAGPSNTTTNTSLWLQQKPYWDSKIARLMTHSGLPNPYPACSANPVDETLEKRSFVSGEMVYFFKYGRDWQPGQTFNLKVIQPNGAIWVNYSYTRPLDWQTFASNYNYFNQTLPGTAQAGTWKFQVTTLNDTYETVFNVNTTRPYAAKTTLCQGDSIILAAMNGGQNFTYQWQRDGNNIIGATEDHYMVTQSGDYRVIATKNAVSTTSDVTMISVTSNSIILNGLAVSGTQQAGEIIVSEQKVNNGISTVYRAGNSISLNPNFVAERGSFFRTELGGCNE